MSSYRLTISGLLAVVAIAAIDLAAVRSPSDAWMWAAFGATLAVLNLAAFSAMAARRRGRIVRGAFALAGGQYLLLACLPPFPVGGIGAFQPGDDSLAPLERPYGRIADAYFRPYADTETWDFTVLAPDGNLRPANFMTFYSRRRAVKVAHYATALIVGAACAILASLHPAIRGRGRRPGAAASAGRRENGGSTGDP